MRKAKSSTGSEPTAFGFADELTAAGDSAGYKLATLAAQIGGEPIASVNRAYGLWNLACGKLQDQARSIAERAKGEREDYLAKGGFRPPKFPAPFDEWLKLVVHGRTVADSKERFRNCMEAKFPKLADKIMAAFEKDGVPMAVSDLYTVMYLDWDNSQVTQTKRQAGNAGWQTTPDGKKVRVPGRSISARNRRKKAA